LSGLKSLLRLDETIQEHKDIIAADSESDEEKATNLLLYHHLKTRDAVIEADYKTC